MSLAEMVRKLTDLGASSEMIAVAVEALCAEQRKDEERRAKRAEQKRKERMSRDSRATVVRQGGDSRSDKDARVTLASHAEKITSLSRDNLEDKTSEAKASSACARERRHPWPADYREETWRRYGKGADKKPGMAALDALHRRDSVAWETFIGGVDRQAEHVEERYRPSLERFIKREKWTDEYAPRQRSNARAGPPPGHVSNNAAVQLAAQLNGWTDAPAPSENPGYFDHGPFIDHEGDGGPRGDLLEAPSGRAGPLSASVYSFVARAGR